MNETQQIMCYLLTSQYGAEWEKIKGELAEGQDLIARMQDKETTLVKYCTYFESTKKSTMVCQKDNKQCFYISLLCGKSN